MVVLFIFTISVYAGEETRKIRTTGKAEVVLEAQYATIQIELKMVDKEISKSHRDLKMMLARLIENLKMIDLKDKDITQSYVLQGQEYSYENSSRVSKGFYPSCSVEVTVENMDKLGALYEVMADYKNLAIRDTNYRRKDEFMVRNAEFKKALLAAKNKAEIMAETLGARIGKVISIREMSVENYLSGNRYYSNTAEFNSDIEKIGFGKVKVTAAVEVEFELE